MGGGSFLGEFEQLVLLAVGRLDDAYGMTVRREIEARTGRSVSIGSVYITIDRLLGKEYLEERTAIPEPRRGGKARRLFRLTAAGIEALKTSRQAQAQMWKGLVLKPLRGGR
jgi:PadR family transcriptional regulator PadR